MTFDEFKKRFEAFTKIDTAEKLAICERQYQQHLLHIEDENYFEPTENKSKHDLISNYERNLYQALSLNTIEEHSFAFLVRPSSAPEHLLVIKKKEDHYFMTLTAFAKSYWEVFHSDNKVVDIDKQVNVSKLDKEIGDTLFVLLNKTIDEARKAAAGRIVLDGVIYSLSKRLDNKLVTITKHSPAPNTKSGKIISVMERLIINFKRPNDIIFTELKAEIKDLLN